MRWTYPFWWFSKTRAMLWCRRRGSIGSSTTLWFHRPMDTGSSARSSCTGTPTGWAPHLRLSSYFSASATRSCPLGWLVSTPHSWLVWFESMAKDRQIVTENPRLMTTKRSGRWGLLLIEKCQDSPLILKSHGGVLFTTFNLTEMMEEQSIKPLLKEWLTLWKNTASRTGSKMEFVYKNALKSLTSYSEPIYSEKDCIKIKYFGKDSLNGSTIFCSILFDKQAKSCVLELKKHWKIIEQKILEISITKMAMTVLIRVNKSQVRPFQMVMPLKLRKDLAAWWSYHWKRSMFLRIEVALLPFWSDS